MMPLFTCAILTYNRFDRLYECLDSVLTQSYSQIEIAICDDGSAFFPKDDITEYIERRKKNNIKRVVMLHSDENLGTVKNINRMIKNSHGDYFMLIGQDDALYDKDTVCELVGFILENKSNIIASYRRAIDEKGREIKTYPRKYNARRFSNASASQQFKQIAIGIAIAGAGTCYSKSFVKSLGMFDESYRLQEDGPFFLRATREGYRIHFFPRISIKYRIGTGVSSSQRTNNELINDVERMFREEIESSNTAFSFLEKRAIRYSCERLALEKKPGRVDHLLLVVKYSDVIIYRLLFSR